MRFANTKIIQTAGSQDLLGENSMSGMPPLAGGSNKKQHKTRQFVMQGSGNTLTGASEAKITDKLAI